MLEERSLAELIPQDIFIGTSLVLRRGDRFLYGIRPAKQGKKQQILELTGIGGSLEEEDQSFSLGAIREAREEIGCRVNLLSCPATLVVRAQNEIEQLTLSGEEQPAAVVFRNHRTPPHQPWHQNNQGEGCLIVFAAEIDGQPWPTMELPNLIWLTAQHILQTARQDVPLQTLIQSGAELIGGNLDAPAENYLTRLTDSQEALALALGDQSLFFYNSLGTCS